MSNDCVNDKLQLKRLQQWYLSILLWHLLCVCVSTGEAMKVRGKHTYRENILGVP